jgi:enoyl-CoA hydratase
VATVGLSKANEMLFTGDRITAKEALEWGFVGKIVPKGEALTESLLLAEKIAGNPPMAVKACKKAVAFLPRRDIEAGLLYETELFAERFAGREQKEQMNVFLNKQKRKD